LTNVNKQQKEKVNFPIKKGDKCPICYQKITKKNCWVRFHIKYNPEMVILSCKNCNYAEYCLRNSIKGSKSINPKRIYFLTKFLKKFDIA